MPWFEGNGTEIVNAIEEYLKYNFGSDDLDSYANGLITAIAYRNNTSKEEAAKELKEKPINTKEALDKLFRNRKEEEKYDEWVDGSEDDQATKIKDLKAYLSSSKASFKRYARSFLESQLQRRISGLESRAKREKKIKTNKRGDRPNMPQSVDIGDLGTNDINSLQGNLLKKQATKEDTNEPIDDIGDLIGFMEAKIREKIYEKYGGEDESPPQRDKASAIKNDLNALLTTVIENDLKDMIGKEKAEKYNTPEFKDSFYKEGSIKDFLENIKSGAEYKEWERRQNGGEETVAQLDSGDEGKGGPIGRQTKDLRDDDDMNDEQKAKIIRGLSDEEFNNYISKYPGGEDTDVIKYLRKLRNSSPAAAPAAPAPAPAPAAPAAPAPAAPASVEIPAWQQYLQNNPEEGQGNDPHDPLKNAARLPDEEDDDDYDDENHVRRNIRAWADPVLSMPKDQLISTLSKSENLFESIKESLSLRSDCVQIIASVELEKQRKKNEL
jgi:hypothetical protein